MCGYGWRGAATRRTHPIPRTADETGLLVGPNPTFAAVGAEGDAEPFAEFYRRARIVTSRLWPTMTAPLRTRDDALELVLAGGDADAEEAWQDLICQPIGQAITEAVDNDLVRGVMATDALIGTFARVDDPSLQQNICFLYHLLGGGTGDWDVPDRRHGCGQRSAGRGRCRLRRRNHHRTQRFTRSTRTARCATSSTASSTGCAPNTFWPV